MIKLLMNESMGLLMLLLLTIIVFSGARKNQCWSGYLGSFNTDYIICRNVEIFPQKINLKAKINCEGNYRIF